MKKNTYEHILEDLLAFLQYIVPNFLHKLLQQYLHKLPFIEKKKKK